MLHDKNGAEALAAAAEHRPHLILLDMMMPVMDGAETCRAIRRDPALRDTMVVFLSALGGGAAAGRLRCGRGRLPDQTHPDEAAVSRVQAILKRIDTTPAARIALDRTRHAVCREGAMHRPPAQGVRNCSTCSAPSREDFSRARRSTAECGEAAWVVGDRTIDVHIRKLRQKIGEERIVTIKGVGYRYEE